MNQLALVGVLLPVLLILPRSAPAQDVVSFLLAGHVALQVLDVDLTFRAMRRGAVETNGLLRPLVRQPDALILTKALVTTLTVVAAKRATPRHKAWVVVALVATNTVYAIAVTRNYRYARTK